MPSCKKSATSWRCSCQARTLEDAVRIGDPTAAEVLAEARWHVARALLRVRDLAPATRNELANPAHPDEPVSAVLAEVARQIAARVDRRP